MTASRSIAIRDVAELESLWTVLLSSREKRLVSVDLPALSPVEAESWRRRINRDAFACGCGTAAGALVLALLTVLTVGEVRADQFFRTPARWSIVGAGFVLACTLVGKAIGIRLASLRLRRT